MRDRRRMLIASQQGGELPSGYTRLNYLESTGTQYINTGVNFAPTMDVDVEFSSQTTTTKAFFGVWENGAYFEAQTLYSVQASVLYYTSGDYVEFTTSKTFDFINLKTDNNNVYVNNTYKGSITTRTRTTTGKLCIFNTSAGTSVNLGIGASMQCKKFKILDNGAVICNLIPCLDNNNVPCMYDTVSRQTFYNAGTGDFLYG